MSRRISGSEHSGRESSPYGDVAPTLIDATPTPRDTTTSATHRYPLDHAPHHRLDRPCWSRRRVALGRPASCAVVVTAVEVIY